MRVLSRMPRFVLVLEGAGGTLLLLSYLTLHRMLPLPAPFSGPRAATLMIFAGMALMLPAALLLVWRMARGMAPELFNVKPDPITPGEKNDADH